MLSIANPSQPSKAIDQILQAHLNTVLIIQHPGFLSKSPDHQNHFRYSILEREALDGHPQRWQVVENLLQLIEDHLPDLQKKFKNSLNLVARDGGFPIAHILDDKVGKELNRWLIQDIAKGTTPFLRLDRQVTPRLYAQIIDALSNRNTTCDSTAFCCISSNTLTGCFR
ncbi:uncharacterized protein PG986_014371 [Apiospora aurea]|uniref:Uncharacterized protein n=1 Tax=Apiospora aurea TaxID=335848 RepID=A0ABR1PST7_9PEZI